MTGLSAVGCGLAVVGRYFYENFIEYSLALMAEVLNGLMGCHYHLWQGQHRQLWLAVVVSCLSSWQIAHNRGRLGGRSLATEIHPYIRPSANDQCRLPRL